MYELISYEKVVRIDEGQISENSFVVSRRKKEEEGGAGQNL